MGDPVSDVIQTARRIAVVGASDDPGRASHGVMRTLMEAGYDVVPVNPTVDEVHGVPAVDSLHEVEGPVDIVDVFRRDEHAPGIAEEAVATGAGTVWLQTGITSAEARRIAQEGGVGFVEDLCLGTIVRRAGLAA